jgi:hypothetical protein
VTKKRYCRDSHGPYLCDRKLGHTGNHRCKLIGIHGKSKLEWSQQVHRLTTGT